MLEKGSDPSIKGGKLGWSPFFLACMIAPQISKKDRYRIDSDLQQDFEFISCTLPEQDLVVKEICEIMLQHFVDNNENDINDKSDKDSSLKSHLLINEEDCFGYTPLHAAILQSNIDLIKSKKKFL
jgi:hypothetical protein